MGVASPVLSIFQVNSENQKHYAHVQMYQNRLTMAIISAYIELALEPRYKAFLVR